MGEKKRRSTHGPVEEEQREIMNRLGRAINDFMNPDGGKTWGFVLLTFRFGEMEGGRINYLANADRDDTIEAMKELLSRFEGKHPEDTDPPPQ